MEEKSMQDFLGGLSDWALIAVAARAARRVRPLYVGPVAEKINAAIEFAESVASTAGSPASAYQIDVSELPPGDNIISRLAQEAAQSAALAARIAKAEGAPAGLVKTMAQKCIASAMKAAEAANPAIAKGAWAEILADIEVARSIPPSSPVTPQNFGPIWRNEPNWGTNRHRNN